MMSHMKKTKKPIITKDINVFVTPVTPFIAAVRTKRRRVLSSELSCNSIESWDGDDGGKG